MDKYSIREYRVMEDVNGFWIAEMLCGVSLPVEYSRYRRVRYFRSREAAEQSKAMRERADERARYQGFA